MSGSVGGSKVLQEPAASTRRTLTFSSLDRVMPDVDQLLQGYRTVGNWTLGQICNHLSSAIQGSVEGFAGKAPWILRKTIGPFLLRRILAQEKMGASVKLPEKFCPKPGLDDRAEAEALRATLAYYAMNTEPPVEHPFFGKMSRDQWTELHRVHCAHHLSFVWPTETV